MRGQRKVFNEQEMEYMRSNVGVVSLRTMALTLNCNIKSISRWLHKNGYQQAMQKLSKTTQFKKGSFPKKTKGIGEDFTVRKNGNNYYVYYRLGYNNWVLYARYVWMLYYGEIPKGFNVTYKDCDTTNCDINNLYLVSRKECMRKNNENNKYPQSLINAIKLTNKIKRSVI